MEILIQHHWFAVKGRPQTFIKDFILSRNTPLNSWTSWRKSGSKEFQPKDFVNPAVSDRMVGGQGEFGGAAHQDGRRYGPAD